MTRDMEVIRALLLKIEDRYQGVGTLFFEPGDEDFTIDGADELAVAYNASLLVDAGYIAGSVNGMGGIMCNGITWAGHDFLDSVRDDEVWRRTKEGAKVVGGLTVDLLIALAKGYAKRKLEAMIGFDITL